jgi:hypothetical protein
MRLRKHTRSWAKTKTILAYCPGAGERSRRLGELTTVRADESDLLAAVVASFSSSLATSDIEGIGQLFLEWLHEVRHRGTFSKLAPAFSRAVHVVRDEHPHLCRSWLEVSWRCFKADERSNLTR